LQRKLTRMVPVGLVLGTVAALAAALTPVHANGNPLTVTLAYLDGVSNWGPTNAAGVAEMVGKEGELRLVASGLPELRGDQYQVWIMNTERGDRMALGSFSAGADGIGKLDLILDEPIPDKQWNLMMISVEPDAAQSTGPSVRHTIAGRFPPASSGNRPGELPRTGGPSVESAPSGFQVGGEGQPPVVNAGVGATLSGGLLGLCALALTLAGFALGRKMSAGKTR